MWLSVIPTENEVERVQILKSAFTYFQKSEPEKSYDRPKYHINKVLLFIVPINYNQKYFFLQF